MPTLKASQISTANKRAHSADTSSSGTPVSEKPPILDDIILPTFLRQSTPEIIAKFDSLHTKQLSRLQHFKSLQDPSSSPWFTDSSKEAKFRNRYTDIKPFSKTRVKLRVGDGGIDYINASSIVLKCSQTEIGRHYIATQGPKSSGVSHFWQMVWDETEDVAVIVMLTQLVENSREKCFQYYPEDDESETIKLNFTNELGEELDASLELQDCSPEEYSRSTIRTLKLSCQGKSKTVYHMLFLGWPDHGVPENVDRQALFELIKLSRTKNDGWSNPRIIHCSAGVGRTGTFIALEHLFEELDRGQLDEISVSDLSIDPIYDTVNALREQRMMMVQSPEQYEFLYDSLAEAYRARVKEHAIAARVESKIKPSGEPAHKAMRLTRHLKTVMSSFRDRSSSRKGEDRKKKTDKEHPRSPLPGSRFEIQRDEAESTIPSKARQQTPSSQSQETSAQYSGPSSEYFQGPESPESGSPGQSGLTQDAADFDLHDDMSEGSRSG